MLPRGKDSEPSSQEVALPAVPPSKANSRHPFLPRLTASTYCMLGTTRVSAPNPERAQWRLLKAFGLQKLVRQTCCFSQNRRTLLRTAHHTFVPSSSLKTIRYRSVRRSRQFWVVPV